MPDVNSLDELLAQDLTIDQKKELLSSAVLSLTEDANFLNLPQLSNKVAAHIFGDKRIRDSKLEGGTIGNNLSFLIPVLELICEKDSDPDLLRLIQKFKELQDLDWKLQAIFQTTSKLTKTQKEKSYFDPKTHQMEFDSKFAILQEIREKLLALGPNESYLIPGSWDGEYEKHSVLYEVFRQEDGRFNFSIINTGLGNAFHIQGEEVHKSYLSPILTKEDVPEEQVCSFTFLSAILFRLRYDRKSYFGKGDNSADREFYQTIMTLLEGVYRETSSLQVLSQQSGTCSWRCLNAYIHYSLRGGRSKQCLFLIKFWSLAKLFMQLKSQTKKGLSIESYMILQEAKRVTNHAALKLYKGQKSTSFVNHDIALTYGLISQVEEFLEENENCLMHSILDEKPEKPIISSSLFSQGVVTLDQPLQLSKYEPRAAARPGDAADSSLPVVSHAAAAAKPPRVLDIKSTAKLQKSLALALKECKSAAKLEKLILQLPIPSCEGSNKLYSSSGSVALSNFVLLLMMNYMETVKIADHSFSGIILNFFHLYSVLHACCPGGLKGKGKELFSEYGLEIPLFRELYLKFKVKFALEPAPEDFERFDQLVKYFAQVNNEKKSRFFDYRFIRSSDGYRIEYSHDNWKNCADFQFLSDYFDQNEDFSSKAEKGILSHFGFDHSDNITKSASLGMMFTKYCPVVFRNLRTAFFAIPAQIEFMFDQSKLRKIDKDVFSSFKGIKPDTTILSFNLPYRQSNLSYFAEKDVIFIRPFNVIKKIFGTKQGTLFDFLHFYQIGNQNSLLLSNAVQQNTGDSEQISSYVRQRILEIASTTAARLPLMLEFYQKEHLLLQEELHQQIFFTMLRDRQQLDQFVVTVDDALNRLSLTFEHLIETYQGDTDNIELMAVLFKSLIYVYLHYQTKKETLVQWVPFKRDALVQMRSLADELLAIFKNRNSNIKQRIGPPLFDYLITIADSEWDKAADLLLHSYNMGVLMSGSLHFYKKRKSLYAKFKAYLESLPEKRVHELLNQLIHSDDSIHWEGQFPKFISTEGHEADFRIGYLYIPNADSLPAEIARAIPVEFENFINKKDLFYDDQSKSYKNSEKNIEVSSSGLSYWFEEERYFPMKNFSQSNKLLENFFRCFPLTSYVYFVSSCGSKAVIVNSKDKKPEGRIFPDKSDAEKIVCHTIEGNLRLVNYQEVKKESALEALIPFAPICSAILFIDPKGCVQKISLLDVKLSFSLIEGLYYCDQHPDLYLICRNSLSCRVFRFIEPGLYLMSSSGQPYFFISPIEVKKKRMMPELLVSKKDRISITQSHLVRLDPISGKMEGGSVFARIDMAKLLTRDGQFGEALELIYSIYGNEEPSANVQEALIHFQNSLQQEALPEYVAMSLHLFILLLSSGSASQSSRVGDELDRMILRYRNCFSSIPQELKVPNRLLLSLLARYKKELHDLLPFDHRAEANVISGTYIEAIDVKYDECEQNFRLPFPLPAEDNIQELIEKVSLSDFKFNFTKKLNKLSANAESKRKQRENGPRVNRQTKFTNGLWYGLFSDGLQEKNIRFASVLQTLITELGSENYLFRAHMKSLIDLSVSGDPEEILSSRFIHASIMRKFYLTDYFNLDRSWALWNEYTQVSFILFLISLADTQVRSLCRKGLTGLHSDEERIKYLCTFIEENPQPFYQFLRSWLQSNTMPQQARISPTRTFEPLLRPLLPQSAIQAQPAHRIVEDDLISKDVCAERLSAVKKFLVLEKEIPDQRWMERLARKCTLPEGELISRAIEGHPLSKKLFDSIFTSLPEKLAEPREAWRIPENGAQLIPDFVQELKALLQRKQAQVKVRMAWLKDFHRLALLKQKATEENEFPPALLLAARARKGNSFLKELAESLLLGVQQLIRKSGLRKTQHQENYIQQTIELLTYATEMQHLQRCLKKVEEASSIISAYKNLPIPEEVRLPLSESLTPVLMADRERGPIPVDRLAFEYLSGIILRKNQARKIDEILKSDRSHFVMKLIMGEGKTRVITPYLALMFAGEGNLPCLVLPSSLKEQGIRELRLLLGGQFQRLVYDFTFSRESLVTPESMENLLSILESLQPNGGFLLTTPEALQGFLLRYIELSLTINDRKHVLSQAIYDRTMSAIASMKAVLKLLRENGVAIADESHVLFRSLQEVNFTLGAMESVPKGTQQLVLFLHQSLIDIGYDFTCSPHALDEQPMEWGHAVKWLAEKLISEFFRFSHENVRIWAKKFLLNETEDLSFLERINEKDPATADQLALAREQLHVFLPHTLEMIPNVEFGRAKQKNREFAVTYHGKDQPSERGEFGHMDIKLNLTARMYYVDGLTLDQFTDWFIKFKGRFIAHISINHKVEEGSSMERALGIFEKDFDPRRVDLQNKQEMNQLFERFKKEPLVVREYLEETIFPSAKQEQKKLTSTASDIGDFFFRRVVTMSGTPFNTVSYPHPLSGSREESLISDKEYDMDMARLAGVLLKDCNDACHTIPDRDLAENFLLRISEKAKTENLRAVIDLGAFFRGVSNADVAKKLLSAVNDIDCVIFYSDDSQEKVVLQRGDVFPINAHECSLSNLRPFAYFDQVHCFGADIPLDLSAHAMLSLPRNVPFHRVLQAAKRMRDIEKHQTISTVITDSFYNEMRAQFGKEEIGLSDLLIYSVEQEGALVEKELVYATGQKLEHQLRKSLLHSHLEDGIALPSEYFITPIGKRPFDLYCTPKNLVNPSELFRRRIENHITPWRETLASYSELDQCCDEIITSASSHLPDLILDRIDAGLDQEVEKQVEVEVNVEINEQRSVTTGLTPFVEDPIDIRTLVGGRSSNLEEYLMKPGAPFALFTLDSVAHKLLPGCSLDLFGAVFVTRNFIRTAATEDLREDIKIKSVDFIVELCFRKPEKHLGSRYVILSLHEGEVLLSNKQILHSSIEAMEGPNNIEVSFTLLDSSGNELMRAGTQFNHSVNVRNSVVTWAQLFDARVSLRSSQLEVLDSIPPEKKQYYFELFRLLHRNREIPTPIAAGNVYERLWSRPTLDQQVINARTRAWNEGENVLKRSRTKEPDE